MKTIRVAINGFGRIGRLFLRIAQNNQNFKVVAINSRADSKNLAYLLKYDSTYGTLGQKINYGNDYLTIEDDKISVSNVNDIKSIPWKKSDVDIVIEATGKFRTKEACLNHINSGAKYVIITSPPKDNLPTFCYGVNHTQFNPKKERIISNASCTTNALATVCKVIEESFGIVSGFMTTIHSYTDSQNLLDNSNPKDFRSGRAAGINLIPTKTGASKALEMVLPELRGKIISSSIRVPTTTISLIDLIVEVKKQTNENEINNAFIKYSENNLKNILGITFDPIVSSDVKGTHYSALVDGLLTKSHGNLINVKAWYDNEWGYSCRLVDMVEYVGKYFE